MRVMQILYGRQYSFDEIAQIVSKVTMDDVLNLASKIFLTEKATLVSIGNVKTRKEKEIGLL